MKLYDIWDFTPTPNEITDALDDEFNVDLHKIIKTSGVGNYISYRKIIDNDSIETEILEQLDF